MDAWAEQATYVDYAPLTEQHETTAPRWSSHLIALGVMGLAGAPAFFLIQRGEMLAGTLILSIPFALICLLQPFMGLCVLVAVAPLDLVFTLSKGTFTGSKALGLVVGLGFLVRLVTDSTARFKLPAALKLTGALALWALLPIVTSSYPRESFLGLSQLLLLNLLVVMMVGMVTTHQHLHQFLVYVFAGCLVVAIFMLAFPTRVSSAERLTLGVSNVNNMGRALTFGGLVGVFLALQSRRLMPKLICLGGSLLILVVIIAGQSRGTWVALGASLTLAGVFAFRRQPAKTILFLIAMALLGMLAVLIAYRAGIFTEGYIKRLQVGGATGRWPIWRAGLRAARAHPLLGGGFNLFPVISGTFRDPHNNYLKLAAETGLPGLALWLGIIFLLGRAVLHVPMGATTFMIASLFGMVTMGGMTMNDFTTKTLWFQMGVILVAEQLYHGWYIEYAAQPVYVDERAYPAAHPY